MAMSPNLDFLAVTNQNADVVSFIDTDPSSSSFHSIASGMWRQAATWNHPSSPPGANNQVAIDGHAVTVDQNAAAFSQSSSSGRSAHWPVKRQTGRGMAFSLGAT